jgi:hypothetical protein
MRCGHAFPGAATHLGALRDDSSHVGHDRRRIVAPPLAGALDYDGGEDRDEDSDDESAEDKHADRYVAERSEIFRHARLPKRALGRHRRLAAAWSRGIAESFHSRNVSAPETAMGS